MATTSFAESFKYGARLFGLFLAVVIFGGGGLGLGAALAEDEVHTWGLVENPDTAALAGGAVLGVLGASILIIGHFAIIHKLIADGVRRGTADANVDFAAGSVEADQSPDSTEQPTTEPTPEQHSQPTAGAAERTPDTESRSPTEPDQPAAPSPEEQPPMESTPGEPTGATQPEETGESGREQTAEEIVFGSSESSEQTTDEPTEESDEPAEQSDDDTGTAGNPGSDPLADNFDEE